MRVPRSLVKGSRKTFLIDSGTTQSLLSQKIAHKIGLRPACNGKLK